MKKSRGKSKAKMAAEEFDAMHGAGVDISDHVDWSSVTRSGLAIHRVNVDFPKWMIERMDREAERLGVTRQSIIKVWIAERIAASEKKIA